jgi:eukaryotic-like serine/threonine-protein kinase
MSLRCPACGTSYPDDARFCPKDGTRLVGAAPTPAAPMPAMPAVPAAAPTPVGGTPAVGAPGMRATTPRQGMEPPAPRKSLNHANLQGEVLDKRYRIVRKVGEGGMSFVYLAQDVATSERYAIKVLSPALAKDANAMARLRREAGLGIRLAHPNVCHIMRLGETEEGLVYVVMPFVDGEILSDRTHRMGFIPLAQAAKWVKEIAQGLQLAHELKIIHRDLKPENIMICKGGDGEDYAVVMDFGLAKERKAGSDLEKLTATGIILGTPEFMSPEQLRGKALDARTDIYSLALMTFEMLTGKLPFEGRTQQEMMIARLRNDPIPLRRMRPDLEFPVPVEKVLLKGMERNPEDRYQTAPEFAEALAIAARGEDPDSPSVTGIFQRIFRR